MVKISVKDESGLKIKKSASFLLDDLYDTPSTSLLYFQFLPHVFCSTETKLESSTLSVSSVENKDIYVLDGFFDQAEKIEMQKFCAETTYSRMSYGSPEAIAQGEKPAKSMNGRERWKFFSNPPKAIRFFFELLSTISLDNALEINTLPWELCNKEGHSSPSIVADYIEEVSITSRDLGIHQNSCPEKKISFAIPCLYSKKEEFFSSPFINGAEGNPWMITAMLYSTAKNYKPEYGMGSVFYDNKGNLSKVTECKDMRLVFFESDLFHSIEESRIPEGIKTARTSFVFKLIFNPKNKDLSAKKAFKNWLYSS